MANKHTSHEAWQGAPFIDSAASSNYFVSIYTMNLFITPKYSLYKFMNNVFLEDHSCIKLISLAEGVSTTPLLFIGWNNGQSQNWSQVEILSFLSRIKNQALQNNLTHLTIELKCPISTYIVIPKCKNKMGLH